MAEELRGSTRAGELVKDKRGGARAGAGRKKGGRNLRKGWDAWVADIQAITRSEFRREKLRELARADAWRFLERIAIPLALRAQPGSLAVKVEDQLELPLIFMDMPGEDQVRQELAARVLGDDRSAEALALAGGAAELEGSYQREPDGGRGE